jgi:hypothetical protein
MQSLADIEKHRHDFWNIKEIPFPDVPPYDAARVAHFFVGRDAEYQVARNRLYRGENILLRGTWGIGKTAFILSSLHRLQQEAKGQQKRLRGVHIRDFRGGKASELYANMSAGLKRTAGRGWPNWLRWMRPSEVGINVLAFEATWGVGKSEETRVVQELYDLFERARRKGQKLVIAIDDLDKTGTGQADITAMLRDALNVLRDERCAFILTGRAITRMDDMEISHLGIVSEIISLKPLSGDELYQAAVCQLNLVRCDGRDDVFPFEDDVIKEIAKKSAGIPRVFYRLCKRTLDSAAARSYKSINMSAFNICYGDFQDDISISVPPEVKRILYYALQRNGFVISSKDETLDEVLPLVGASTVYDLVPHLDALVKADYMVRVERPDGISYEIAPGTEKAAEEGQKVKG